MKNCLSCYLPRYSIATNVNTSGTIDRQQRLAFKWWGSIVLGTCFSANSSCSQTCVSLRSLRKRQQQTCLAITGLIRYADNQWSTEDCFLIDSRYQGRSLINMHNIISKLSGSTPEWARIHHVLFPTTRLFTSRDVSTLLFSSE